MLWLLGAVTPDRATPPTIADYELLRLIGRGSYGDVWLGRGLTGAFRAIKIVWRDRFPDVRPYEREFEGVTRFTEVSLKEPSQLALLHVGRDEPAGFFYYVMELADDATRGRDIDPNDYVPLTLKELRERRGQLSPAEVVSIGVALATGLSSLHAAGLVHRDIKPSNAVFVGGVLKLADVGLVATASQGLTFVGTEGFVPPEGPGAPAADVFSCGKVLYELVTDFDRQDWPRLPLDLGTRPDRRAFLELNEVLIRACDPNSQRRFSNAAALLDELLLLRAGKSVRRLRAAERRTARALRAAAFLGAIAAVAALGVWAERRRAEHAEAERDALARRTVYAATLAQTQRALDDEDLGRARQLLHHAEPPPGQVDLRDLEWRTLWRQAQGDNAVSVRESGPPADRVALSPDETILAVHDASRTTTLYRSLDRQEVRRIPNMHRLAGFSADGNWLIGTTPDYALQRWSATTGMPDGPARGGRIYRPLGIQGNDAVVAFADGDPAILIVWDFRRQSEAVHLPFGVPGEKPPWGFYRGVVDPAGSSAFIVCVRDTGNNLHYQFNRARLDSAPELVRTDALLRPSAVGVLRGIAEQAEWWAVENTRGSAVAFAPDAREWRTLERPLPLDLSFQALIDHPDRPGVIQAVGSKIILSDLKGSVRRELRGHAASIIDVALARDQFHLYSASSAGDVRSWNLAAPTTAPAARQCRDSIAASNHVFYAPDGATLYAPEVGGGVVALDSSTLEKRGLVSAMLRPVGVNARQIWGLSNDGRALLGCDRTSLNAERELARGGDAITQAALSGDGHALAFTRQDGSLHYVDLNSGAAAVTEGRYERIWPLQLDDRGRRVCILDADRRMHCVELTSGKVLWSSEVSPLATSYSWLAARKEIVVATRQGELQFVDEVTGKLLRSAQSVGANVQAVIGAKGSERLIAADLAGALYFIDVNSGVCLATLRATGRADPTYGLAVAPTGDSLAVISKSGVLRVVAMR